MCDKRGYSLVHRLYSISQKHRGNQFTTNFLRVPLQCGFPPGNAVWLREQTKALAVDRGCTSLWKFFIYRGCVMLLHCVTLPIIVTELNDKVLSPHCKSRAASFHFSVWSWEHCWAGTKERQEPQTGAAMAANCSALLKIQLLGNIKSEFTSIKQKLSISHSSIIKYWHQE